MQLVENLKSLFAKKSQHKPIETYKSIKDLPIGIWWDIHETNDIFKLAKGEYSEGKDLVQCVNLWEFMKDEHYNEFGYAQGHKDYLRKLANLHIKKCDAAISENGIDITKRDIAQKIFDNEFKRVKPNNYKTKATIEKILWNGQGRIDINTVTVIEYYNYIELSKDTVKQYG